jgi:bis(5'-nucleosyl)-tetraphosphatase (symmetrical)
MATIAIGDVHGCLAELDELLALIGGSGRHRLVFLGDLVDRGPDPVGVVRRVRELRAECVLGNHDEKHVRWARHEARRATDPSYANPMRPLPPERLAQHAALGADGIAFLAGLPAKLELAGGWWAVHGGAAPNQPLATQKVATLIRCRYVDRAGKPITSAAPPPPNAEHWAARWAGPERLVYGHHVHDLATPRHDPFALGIDTGCCFGGRLTAFLVESGELISVPARRAYAPLREANGDEP